MTQGIQTLQEWIDDSQNIVFFGGAGVSTESGIPDFRSVDGLYSQQYDYPPETILSHSFFERYPAVFFRFYREKILKPLFQAEPNAAHRKLAELEQAGKLKAIITQNIDGLHQEAGSKEVLELHGSVLRNYCPRCDQKYNMFYIAEREGIPYCDVDMCGGIMRPDIVLYEEALDTDLLNRATEYIRNADILIIGGTSLVVYPAAGLIHYYQGQKLVLINKSPTSMDSRADLVLNMPIGQVFDQIKVNS